MQLTNVNDMPLFVQHDIAIVPVFNLEQKQQKAIGSHAADEVIASLCEEKKLVQVQKRRAGLSCDPREKDVLLSRVSLSIHG